MAFVEVAFDTVSSAIVEEDIVIHPLEEMDIVVVAWPVLPSLPTMKFPWSKVISEIADHPLPPPPIQDPLIWKHFPVGILMLPVKDEVAEPVMFKRLASIPPAKVEVAVDVVAMKYPATTGPATESLA